MLSWSYWNAFTFRSHVRCDIGRQCFKGHSFSKHWHAGESLLPWAWQFWLSLNAGERCQRANLYSCQHFDHSCNPVGQLMGCNCHIAKGKNANPHANRLRLCCQRCLKRAHCPLPERHAKSANINSSMFCLGKIITERQRNQCRFSIYLFDNYIGLVQTWNLLKHSHDQIFGPKILHTKNA